MKQFLLGLLIIVGLGMITIFPLFHQGFFPVHDSLQVARVYQMNEALRDGAFPVRVVRDLGYGFGYAIFNYYAPLSYYLGGVLSFIVHPLIATKIMIGLGMILAGVTMYFLARHFMRIEGAVIASVLYLFIPYHALNLYVRGAIAELYAYSFVPLAFYGLIRLSRRPSHFSILLAALGLSLVILSHNLTALMLIPYYGAVFLYFLYQKRASKKVMGYLITSVLLGLGLSCFYWLPAYMEKDYVNLASVLSTGSIYKDNFVCLGQLWSSPWDFGGSLPGCIDALSFQIGKVHVLLAAVGILLLAVRNPKRRYLIFFLGGALSAIFMLLEISQPLWDAIPVLRFLQFPWRYLQFVALFLSLSGGVVVAILMEMKFRIPHRRYLHIAGLLLLVLLIGVYYSKYFTPKEYIKGYQDQTKRDELVWNVSFLSDEYLPSDFVKPKSLTEVPTERILSHASTVRILRNTSTLLEAEITSSGPDLLTINKTTYPFWQFHLNSERVYPKEYSGRYQLSVPGGEHHFIMSFASTPIERTGNFISLISLAAVLIGIIQRVTIRRYAKTS